MRGSLIIPTIFYCVLFGLVFYSCDKEDTSEIPTKKSKRTVLMYIVGKNNLSDDLMYDFNEIKQGYLLYPNAEEINLLIYISNKSKYDTPTLLKLHKEEFNNSILEEEVNIYPGVNSTDPEIMKEIMLEAFISYPAQSYGLIMCSHADGWLPYPKISMRSFGDDDGKEINIVDLASVLNDVAKSIGKKLDYLLFDACLMQSVEVAYELRHSVNFLIGSPAEIPAAGGYYDIMTSSLFDVSTDFNENIVNSFFSSYEHKSYNGLAISSINTKYIDDFSKLSKELLLNSLDLKQDINLKDVPSYDGVRKGNDYFNCSFYYDIYSLVESIAEKKKVKLFNQWKDIYNKMVYYRHTNYVYSGLSGNQIPMDGTHGVSCYVPRQGYENMTNHYRTHQWYEVGGWKDLGW